MNVAPQHLFLTAREAAVLLRCSPSHVYRLCKRGDLEFKQIGDRVLIPRVELETMAGGVSLLEALTGAAS